MVKNIDLPGIGELKIEENAEYLAYSVLLLDDDRAWASATQKNLQSRGISNVEVANSAEEADKKLGQIDFDAVLFDIQLGQQDAGLDHDAKQGDTWLLEHCEKLTGCLKIALTAHPGRIGDRQALDRNEVEVVVKTNPRERDLYDELEKNARQKRKEGIEKLTRLAQSFSSSTSCEAVPKFIMGNEVASQAADLFQEWASTRIDPDKKEVYLGDKHLSVSELADEVMRGSEVGERMLKMFIRHVRHLLGLSLPRPERTREQR